MPEALTQDPSQLGAWLYSCELASHEEEAAMCATMPDLPLQVRQPLDQSSLFLSSMSIGKLALRFSCNHDVIH